MKKNKIDSAVKAGFVILTASLIILLPFFYIFRRLQRSEYFKIKNIVARGLKASDLSYLYGSSFFNVDLEKESDYIRQSFPQCSQVRLIRVFPNCLFADCIKRIPQAIVKLQKYFYVDKEGVLFYNLGAYQRHDLPMILGLENRISSPKSGKKYNLTELSLALEIIEEIRRDKFLSAHQIKNIELTSPEGASVFLFPDRVSPLKEKAVLTALEVKVGSEDIKSKIFILSGLMEQTKVDLSRIKYIDLRFKEPVIKLKDAK
ncbi:MAG: cell division protein FtsQ/DivIB [Candidatus Omnitrophota bacterium]